MNERIRLIAEQAGLKVESFMTKPPKPFQILGSTEQFEKFAELMVAECINVVEQTPTHCAFTTYDYPTVICTISKSVEFLKTEFGLPK